MTDQTIIGLALGAVVFIALWWIWPED